MASWGTDRLDIFVRGGDAAVWTKSWTSSGWTAWTSIGGQIAGRPAAVSWGPDRIDVVAHGLNDDQVWHNARSLSCAGNHWCGWNPKGGTLPLGASPTITSWGSNRLDILVRGADDFLWHRYFNGSWGNWTILGGKLRASPAAVARSTTRIDVVATSDEWPTGNMNEATLPVLVHRFWQQP
jgi:hypothetical protein